MKLYKILLKISIYISIKLFKIRLPLSYSFYNFLYKKLILKIKNNNDYILKFEEHGFSKLNLDFEDLIEKYNIKHSKVKEKDFNNHRTYFFLEKKHEKSFQNDLLKKINPIIKDLENYYNVPVYLLNFKAFRIEHFNHIAHKNLELYANKFHNDGYVMNFFKIFINLENISDNDGPLHLISKKYTKEFINKTNYHNRDNYNSNFDDSIIFKNTGKKGSSLIFSPSLCFHKAGIPNNYRDTIQLVLAALPINKKELSNEDLNIFEDNKHLIYLTKPYGFFHSLKFLINNFKHKHA
tara:strand:+ start:176 stop:1057 length:882 start_codon:yes stop_codon:yes gene_type:complete